MYVCMYVCIYTYICIYKPLCIRAYIYIIHILSVSVIGVLCLGTFPFVFVPVYIYIHTYTQAYDNMNTSSLVLYLGAKSHRGLSLAYVSFGWVPPSCVTGGLWIVFDVA